MNRKVKRYDPISSDGTCGMCIEDADFGAYVEYEDYAALEAENERLRKCLSQANKQAEHFERSWYLVSDQRDMLAAILRQVMPDYMAPPGMGHIYVEAEAALGAGGLRP